MFFHRIRQRKRLELFKCIAEPNKFCTGEGVLIGCSEACKCVTNVMLLFNDYVGSILLLQEVHNFSWHNYVKHSELFSYMRTCIYIYVLFVFLYRPCLYIFNSCFLTITSLLARLYWQPCLLDARRLMLALHVFSSFQKSDYMTNCYLATYKPN